MKPQTHSRYETARKFLIFWCLFIGIGAVGGATGMLVSPDGSAMGMGPMLPAFQVLPFADVLFQDFVFPGIALLCVNGLPNLIAAALLLARRRAGVVCGGLFGVTLMLWICIQFVIFPFNFMSTAYFIFGLAQAATGWAAYAFEKQEQFAKTPRSYPNIGRDAQHLVVYFSRMGYTRAIALETADRLGAQVFEVRATERTEGTAGFWWCGRYGMHRWPMPIAEIPADLAQYARVTICTPIWVFHVSAPIRRFCQAARGQISAVDYVLVHHQRAAYENAAREMDALLGIVHTGAESVCCRLGRVIARRQIPGGAA